MKETLIGFNLAVLAHQKGFNEECTSYYNMGESLQETRNSIKVTNSSLIEDACITAPTQSLLQKWLREKHKILIFPYINFQEEDYFYCSIFPVNKDRFSTEDCLTYEEALEAGLQEALNLIE